MATTIHQLPAPTAGSDQDSLVTSRPARHPGTAVSVMGPCRPAAVSLMGRDRGTVSVMGRDRGTAASVTAVRR